eukprot:gnl/TRDRNA2_/TRDRNA2_174329_c3_seq1.p1 gnl/TRDRNA2_/TRDRNA2_174329_c3~~gnl/TRDRNA2_/TRDRNA2_174329_c3_seq1.p1  ORF type:complete len:300 (+),score=59.89 gnl/TRDRNA2_/TRDRNA2_174329_c3_seq1:2-901(+)
MAWLRRCVIAQHSTEPLQRLQGEAQAKRQAAGPVFQKAQQAQALETALQQVQTLMCRAQGMYDQATQMQRAAKMDNLAAGAFALFGDDLLEGCEQALRDSNMNQAMVPAREASALMHQAFQQVPADLRVRYPEHCGNLCQVQIPSLEGQNLGMDLLMDFAGGSIGELANDWMAGSKIERNLQALQYCQQAAQQQLGVLNNLLQYVSNEARQAQYQYQQCEGLVRQLEQQIAEQENRIFLEAQQRHAQIQQTIELHPYRETISGLLMASFAGGGCITWVISRSRSRSSMHEVDEPFLAYE